MGDLKLFSTGDLRLIIHAQTGYDLWEEVHGSSFFTISAQHRALVQGGLLAKELGEECAACEQASQVLCFLENNFWNASGGYLTADVNVNNVNRSGINADPLLAAITNFDINATCNASRTFCPFFAGTRFPKRKSDTSIERKS